MKNGLSTNLLLEILNLDVWKLIIFYFNILWKKEYSNMVCVGLLIHLTKKGTKNGKY